MHADPDILLDQALERLATTGPEYAGGLSNHAPMVAEALHHLGHADLIAGWIDDYVERLEPRPSARGQPPMLARLDSWADWQQLFERELDTKDWREVVARWVPHLAPGLFAGATHGLLRTAHALRMLRTLDNRLRRGELASALGYWAAAYQTLPGDVRPRGSSKAAEVLAALPAIPHEGWLITEAIRGLDRVPELASLLAQLDPHELELERLLAAISPWTAAGAGVSAIVHVHVLTSTVALLEFEALLERDAFGHVLAHAWHAAAALIGTWRPNEPQRLPATPVDRDLLITRALLSRDEHAIKLVDACLTGFDRFGDVGVLHAANALLSAISA